MGTFLQSAAAASNVLLVIVTVVYVYLTYRILKANHRTVEIMQQQAEAVTRPYIVVDAFNYPGEPFFRLRIRNLGGSSALNLRLRIDRPLYRMGEMNSENDFSKFHAFANAIPAFVPKAELVFNLGETVVMFDSKFSKALPSRFAVIASYEYQGRTVEEKNDIDIAMYYESALNPDALVEQVKKINRNLDNLKCAVEDLGAGAAGQS